MAPKRKAQESAEELLRTLNEDAESEEDTPIEPASLEINRNDETLQQNSTDDVRALIEAQMAFLAQLADRPLLNERTR